MQLTQRVQNIRGVSRQPLDLPCIARARQCAVKPTTHLARPGEERLRLSVRAAASSDSDEEGSGYGYSTSTAVMPTAMATESTASADAYSDDEMSADDLKAALLDSLYGTERGLAARSEVRAEINELISQLEAKNPTPNPTEALDKLDGNWKLLYTSNSELIAVLALSKLPFVVIGDVTQRIDTGSLTVENKVGITVPFSRTAFTTTASFEVRSPKRLQLKLEKGGVQTPELLSDIELPSTVSVLGQAIDLTNLNQALSPVNEGFKGLLSQVNNLISQAPELQFDIPSERAQTWQLNTYVDADTRVTRGDGGSVFIYVKDVSIAA